MKQESWFNKHLLCEASCTTSTLCAISKYFMQWRYMSCVTYTVGVLCYMWNTWYFNLHLSCLLQFVNANVWQTTQPQGTIWVAKCFQFLLIFCISHTPYIIERVHTLHFYPYAYITYLSSMFTLPIYNKHVETWISLSSIHTQCPWKDNSIVIVKSFMYSISLRGKHKP